ncbi:MAG: fluoride efflux transporter CrcB [Mycobacterium sp.]|nr:fluoride efflux transporter CrcB [Mycobacterium sp.]
MAWPSATPPQASRWGCWQCISPPPWYARSRCADARRGRGAALIIVWLGVLVAGGIGAVLRFLVDGAVARRIARSFPFGTLTVNISGAVLLGMISNLALNRHAALLVDTAFIGSYTTFSTWMLETQRLGEERQISYAVANVVVSMALGLAAALLGQWIAGRL